jgi:trk system potassium uptake protein TrkA
MNVVIVGGGKTVYFLCRTFLAKDYSVTVISKSQEDCVHVARRLKATVVRGDGSDPTLLDEAGVRSADVVLAATPNDETNLAISQLASLHFGVPRAVAVVNDPDNEAVFRSLGVAAFSVTRIIASLIEQRASLDEITNLIPVAEGKINITEVTLRPDAPVVDKFLRDVKLPTDSLVAVVLRDGGVIVPNGATRLQAGDRITLITTPENHGPVVKGITGELT